MTDEEVVMGLIVPAGNAKSDAIKAIAAARRGDFQQADELISKADEEIIAAHERQSEEIRDMLSGKAGDSVNLIMVHGQDHLMNAITTIDLSKQIIGLLKELKG